ncbi:MAG TPA: SMP-30/gluconolactonase/LRE family protein, partial [Solirubrobacterales bacterium]|nr:SMP-30/gluconolactonase/LRE family protein [Solirubrobacterales bacterium]
MRFRKDLRLGGTILGLIALALFIPVSQVFACEYKLEFGDTSTGAGQLSLPRDVAVDPSGNVWVADTGHKRVQKFNSSGEFVSQFGLTSLTGVNGITTDASGNVLVATATKIRKYKSNGELLSEFGSEGTGNGQFKSAQDLAVDASGSIWVVDKGSAGTAVRVQKFNSSGVYQSQFGKEGTGNGEFKLPEAIAVDSEGNLLVADTGNNRYQEFNSAGEFVRKVGSAGTGNGQFESPRGIAVDSEGRVWVADSGNSRIQRFSSKGSYQAQIGIYGPNPGEFIEPRGIAISGSNLWVADTGNNRGQKFNLTPEFLLDFGDEASGPGRLSAPRDVAIDAGGNAWVADTGHKRVQKFNSSGEFVSQFGISAGVT